LPTALGFAMPIDHNPHMKSIFIFHNVSIKRNESLVFAPGNARNGWLKAGSRARPKGEAF
jgi:hypothetical protein